MSPTAPTAWLVLGPPHLLDGARPLDTAEVVAVVAMRPVEQDNPTNTVVLTWRNLYATSAAARILDGTRLAATKLPGGDLFDHHARPSAALRRLLTHAANGNRSPVTPLAASWVPLFYASATPAVDLLDIHVYSQIQFHAEDACFIRTTATPFRARPDDFFWLYLATELHRRQASFLNSHECSYRTCFPGLELEHKYTLRPDTDLWELALETRQHVGDGRLRGLSLKYRDELQRWDYVNHVFEITDPEPERGYVSLIPMTDGTYLVKRKWFTEDAFTRREHHAFGTTIAGPLHTYVKTTLNLPTQPLPSYRRVRYDVNVEATRTGHTYAVLYDRCTLLDTPNAVLTQCEIEYNRTRTALPPDESTVLTDMDRLADLVEELTSARHPAVQRGTYSKLSFLRRHRR